MRQLFFWAIVLTTFSCDNKSNDTDFVEYVQGRQLLTVNKINRSGEKDEEPIINILKPDSAQIGKEFVAKIFLSKTDALIANAFVDCDNVDNASVDTVTYKVSGCKHGLIVISDTIFVAIKPTNSGRKRFSEITILTRDSDRVFRTMKYTFDYSAAEK